MMRPMDVTLSKWFVTVRPSVCCESAISTVGCAHRQPGCKAARHRGLSGKTGENITLDHQCLAMANEPLLYAQRFGSTVFLKSMAGLGLISP
jgi:hypothetical protein